MIADHYAGNQANLIELARQALQSIGHGRSDERADESRRVFRLKWPLAWRSLILFLAIIGRPLHLPAVALGSTQQDGRYDADGSDLRSDGD